MTRRRMLVALGATAALGCRGASVVEEAAPVDGALSDPWTDAGLPIGEGRVVFSNRRMVTVVYEGGSVDALAATWRGYVGGRGWVRTSEVSGDDMRSYGFTSSGGAVPDTGPGATLALGIYPGTDGIVVTLTLFSPGGDGEQAGEPT